MPTYLNSTTETVVVGPYRIGPGEELKTTVFFPASDLPAGVTKTSDDPYYNPIISSGKYVDSDVITLPDDMPKFGITIYVDSGEWEIRYTSASNDPPMKIGSGQSWSRVYPERIIKDIQITKIVDGTIWVHVERE